jgi:hypothetical protein
MIQILDRFTVGSVAKVARFAWRLLLWPVEIATVCFLPAVISPILRLEQKQKLYSKRVRAEQGRWWNHNSLAVRVISTHWIETVYQDKRQHAMYIIMNNDRVYKF